jgi:hypothetical protein
MLELRLFTRSTWRIRFVDRNAKPVRMSRRCFGQLGTIPEIMRVWRRDENEPRRRAFAFQTPWDRRPRRDPCVVEDCHNDDARSMNQMSTYEWLTDNGVENANIYSIYIKWACPFEALQPPSTGRFTPLTKLASSLARKATTLAISSGCAARPKGIRES